MNRFKCPACRGNQYTSKDEAEGCIYCVYKGPLELMDKLEPEESEVEYKGVENGGNEAVFHKIM